MAAKYVLKPTRNGQFTFALHAGNGEPILSSEPYTTKEAAKDGIASVQKNSSDDSRYEAKTANNEKKSPYFVLKAANHQVVGTSEMYSSPTARDNGIEAVKKNASTTEISDET